MAGTSELIDFRRAFVWLLCGMLLPSVALIAFGVVAVVNERAAVERRLETQYGARLRTLDADVRARLDAAAANALARAMASEGSASAQRLAGNTLAAVQSRMEAAQQAGVPNGDEVPVEPGGSEDIAAGGATDAGTQVAGGSPNGRADGASSPNGSVRGARGGQGGRDPLVGAIVPAPVQTLGAEFAAAVQKAEALPLGGHLLATINVGGDRRLFALLRIPGAAAETSVVAAQLDLVALAAEVPKLAAARFPRDYASYRLLPPAEPGATIATLRRLLGEVAPQGRATIVARLPLQAPLDGFALGAEVSGDDPAATLAFRNRTWYIALLALLYTGIGVGFGLTIREMRRAYKLSRLKTDFVANISHELRTPLTSVRLFAETLKQGRAQGPQEVQQCLDLLTKETQRLSSLVEKLLDWSRLESGRKLLRREPTRVEALLDHVADVFRAQQLGTTYETKIEPGLPPVSVDRDAMAQVVLNLLHNAVKFTGPDKQIGLRARRTDRGVAIEVEDNGIGVREKDRKRIFERFYRADDLLSRRTEGTGLGLAIAKRLVEAHGGRIDVESRPGGGSVFRVQIPAAA
jgi:two-component system, OmpR family, phosphate regulon sensor histidine kinase PhoR